MTEGGKRIDLGAPLRSVRRADALPYHKADLKSGPAPHPGAVPFVWEQRPGQPKSVRTRRAPPTPPASSQAQPSENGGEEEIDTSPYHDALGDRGREVLHGVAAGSRTIGAAARKEEERVEVVVEAKKEVKTQDVVAVAAVLRKEEDDDEEEERFSDALDTLSRTESFTVNCSVSGLSGMPDPAPGAAAGAEPGARGFMMDRFLPAAQAVAVGSPQYTFRKAGATGNSGRALARAATANVSMGSGDDRARRAPVQLPYQHLPPNYLSCNYPRREEREEEEEEEEEDDDDYDVHSTRGFASKGCGLLPGLCVKSSLLLLNPVPAMKGGKTRGRGRDRGLPSKGRGQKAPKPLARNSQNKHLGCDSNGQSWEEVYKYKLEQKCLRQVEDGRSKVTSESNQLTFWSDSQTGDGSSPFYHSIGGGVSPYHRDVVVSPSSKANGSFGIGDKDEKMCRSNDSSSLRRDHDRGSLVGSDHSSLKGSSSMSSGLDRTVHEDLMDHRENIDSETSRLTLLLDSKSSLSASGYDSQLEGRQIGGRNPIGKGQGNNPSTERISKITEPTFLMPFGNPASMKLDDVKPFIHDASQDGPLQSQESPVVKKEIMPLQSLLPLPVPKSPSESWLSRTLPSVTNKQPVPSFLGIQVQSKKQSPWSPMHPKENGLKPSRPRQIRFADVLERPNSSDSEI